MATLTAAKLDAIGYATKFFANEQGRDKANKIIQYGARWAAYELKQNDPKSELAKQFTGLFGAFRDARKLLRFFKQFGELQKIQVLLKQQPSLKQQLQIAGAAGLATYWTFDNLVFLHNAKFLTSGDKAQWAKLAMFGWWIGISTALVVDGMALRDNVQKEAKLRANLQTLNKPTAEPNSQVAVNETRSRAEKELSTLLVQRTTLVMNLAKNTGDWLVASNGWELNQRLGSTPWLERTVSIGGLMSGIIVCYQVYRTL